MALRVWRVELAKLRAQLAVRVLAAVCVLGPVAFVVVIHAANVTPTDTLFGRWVHDTGFAAPLVVLGFARAWGFPVLAGVVGGDLFSSEDRHGTWKTLLGRSAGRWDVFAGKVLAAATCAAGLTVLLAVSSVAAGVAAGGAHHLVGLSGAVIAPGRCLALVAGSWAIMLMPVLAFTSLALLLSVASRSGIVGVLGPLVIATVMLLLSLAGGGEAARALMIVNAFDAWHGLFADPAYLGPVLEAAIASVVYVVGCLGAAWAILLRRDFAGEERRALPRGAIAAAAGVVALLAIAEVATPSGITAARLESSANTSFANLASLQQQLLGRLVPRGLSLPSRAHCRRRGGRAGTTGPGGDWGCSIVIAIPPPHVDTVDVHYDVTVRPNGCYTASGPETFLGQRLLPGRNGTVNPLFEFDGCFDTS